MVIVNYAGSAHALPIFLTSVQIEKGSQTLLLMLLSLLAAFTLYCSLMALYKRSPQNIATDRAESERFISNVSCFVSHT